MVRLTLEKGRALTVQVIPYRFDADGGAVRLMKGEERDAMLAYIARLSDSELTEKYFMGWRAEKGIRWLGCPGLPTDYLECGAKRPLDCAPLYNLFFCEAHAG